jgi:hypothetical protein
MLGLELTCALTTSIPMRPSAVSTKENLPSSPIYLIFHYKDISKCAQASVNSNEMSSQKLCTA